MNDELFEEDLNKKKKRIGKNKPAMGWLTALGIIVAGFVLMATPIFLFSSLPEPHWGNTVAQNGLATATNTTITWIIYGILLIIFYVWCWRQKRTIAIILAFLQLVVGFGCYSFTGAVIGVGGGIDTTLLAQIENGDTTYVLVTRNIVGNGKLDLYRCINAQCQGRMIALDEWATYDDAHLSIGGEPPQLVVEALGNICFDLAKFDADMLTYVTRPESGMKREGWESGCADS